MQKHELIAPWLMDALDPQYRTDRVNALVSNVRRFMATNVVGGIACCGISGMSMAFAVADIIGLPVCVIRKDRDHHHSSGMAEGLQFDNYIIIDDFVQTGATVQHIIAEMKVSRLALTCLAVFTYHASDDEMVSYYEGNVRRYVTAYTGRNNIDGVEFDYPTIGMKPPTIMICDDTDGIDPVKDYIDAFRTSYADHVVFWSPNHSNFAG